MRPPDPREERTHILVNAIRQLVEGRSNAAGQVTLTPGAATTVVESSVISPGSVPQLTPASATAAAEWAAGTIYVSAVLRGSFAIAHSSDPDGTRVIHWHAVGG